MYQGYTAQQLLNLLQLFRPFVSFFTGKKAATNRCDRSIALSLAEQPYDLATREKIVDILRVMIELFCDLMSEFRYRFD